jgi:hypothetical protein
MVLRCVVAVGCISAADGTSHQVSRVRMDSIRAVHLRAVRIARLDKEGVLYRNHFPPAIDLLARIPAA